MYSQKKADRAIRFWRGMKHTSGSYYGMPFNLLPWQQPVLHDVYGAVDDRGLRIVRFVYIEIPKKNGKSEFAAAASLFHTFADGEKNGQVYACAGDRAQASIVFDIAVSMIDQSPALKKRARLILSQKIIKDKVSGTVYKAVSSEAYTKHGLNVSGCVFDELHAQPNRNLWDVMTYGAGDARDQPIWYVITTAGDDPDRVSIGWEVHERAVAISKGEIIDPSWYVAIYNYERDNEKDEDIFSEEAWREANPAIDHILNIDTVRAAADLAKESEANRKLFEWLRLNRWVSIKLTSWLPLDLWDSTAGEWSRADLLGLDCYIGLDLSSTTDLTSVAFLFPPQKKLLEWRVFWNCYLPRAGIEDRVMGDGVPYDIWADQGYLTLTDGDVIDYDVIEADILEARKFFKIKQVGADRAMATMLLGHLEKEGLEVVDVPQTYQSLTDPMNQIEIFLRAAAGMEKDTPTIDPAIPVVPVDHLKKGRLTHMVNPCVRWSFGNTSIAQNGQGYKKFVKQTKGKGVERKKRIDPIAAFVDAMAVGRFYSGPVDISEKILSKDWGM